MKKISSVLLAVMMAFCTVFMSVDAYALDAALANSQLAVNGYDALYCDSQWREYNGRSDMSRSYYKFTVASEGKINIRIEASGFLEATLSNESFSADYFTIYSMATTQPQTVYRNQVIPAGTYYFSVSSASSYKINATFGGNSSGNAQVLLQNTTVNGAPTDSDGGWWYRINASKASLYTFVATASATADIVLYTGDLKGIVDETVCSANEQGIGSSKKNIYLEKGTYYIKVESGGDYSLNWYMLTKDNCEHTYLSQYINATYLKKGYQLHTCSICGRTYKDNYSAKLKLDTPTVKSLKKGSRKITVNIARTYRATGYQIQYSKNSKFKGKTTKKISTKNLTKTIKGLKGRTKYYVRVRAYKKIDGKTVFSSWSDVGTIRTGR